MSTIATGANKVYSVEVIAVDDDLELTLKPAVIKTLRAGNAKMQEFFESTDEETGLTKLLEAAVICVQKQLPDDFGLDEAEEVFDVETVYKIIEVCLGIKLNDPKLLEAIQEAELAKARSASQTLDSQS